MRRSHIINYIITPDIFYRVEIKMMMMMMMMMMLMVMIRLCQFTGVGSSTEKGGRRELKVREAGVQGTGGGTF